MQSGQPVRGRLRGKVRNAWIHGVRDSADSESPDLHVGDDLEAGDGQLDCCERGHESPLGRARQLDHPDNNLNGRDRQDRLADAVLRRSHEGTSLLLCGRQHLQPDSDAPVGWNVVPGGGSRPTVAVGSAGRAGSGSDRRLHSNVAVRFSQRHNQQLRTGRRRSRGRHGQRRPDEQPLEHRHIRRPRAACGSFLQNGEELHRRREDHRKDALVQSRRRFGDNRRHGRARTPYAEDWTAARQAGQHRGRVSSERANGSQDPPALGR